MISAITIYLSRHSHHCRPSAARLNVIVSINLGMTHLYLKARSSINPSITRWRETRQSLIGLRTISRISFYVIRSLLPTSTHKYSTDQHWQPVRTNLRSEVATADLVLSVTRFFYPFRLFTYLVVVGYAACLAGFKPPSIFSSQVTLK